MSSAIGPVSACIRCGAKTVMWVDLHGLNLANVFHDKPMRKQCRRCGWVRSLGPANDASEAVQVEIRAAEIALALRQSDLTAIDWGWHGEAGMLARCIWEHEQ